MLKFNKIILKGKNMSNITTVYLIRHSKKLSNELVNHENNNEYYQNRREKIVLSIEGEKRAELLSKEREFDDIDVIYSSNFARTIQTAKYFAESRNMIIHIDNRFNERRLGIVQNEDITIRQYYDENLKNPDGESQKEVRERMKAGFQEIVNNNREKNIAVFTHGAAITFLLMCWCKLEYIHQDKHKCLSFNNKIIVDKIFDAPEVFKLQISDEDEILSIENLVFNSLK